MQSWTGFEKGVNLGGWLSQCDYTKQHMDTFIVEDDIKLIASWGADHVRLPIDFNIIENSDGTYSAEGFGYIDKALKMAIKNRLNLVIDLHKTAGFSFDYGEKESGFFESEALQERFYRLWEAIAQRYGSFFVNVAFEILNEVTDEVYISEWNRISHQCIKRIRMYAPKSFILVGSYHNNSATTVSALAKPYDDKVIYNFHCYEPLPFTHQGATWAPTINPNDRMSYDHSGCDEQFFEELFASAIETAKKNGTMLYCGEYGVINKATPDDTVKWYKSINAIFKKYGIGRSAWSYKKMDFGLVDDNLDDVRSELIKLL